MITFSKRSLHTCLHLIWDYIMNQTKTTIYPILSSYVIRQELRWTGVREMPTGRCRNQSLLPECLSSRGHWEVLVHWLGFCMVFTWFISFLSVVFHLVLLLNFMGCRELDRTFYCFKCTISLEVWGEICVLVMSMLHRIFSTALGDII